MQQIIEFIPEAIRGESLGVLFALITAGLLNIFRSKAKLVYGRANNSRNVVFTTHEDGSGAKQISHEIYVEKFFLQNTGRSTATNVEFVLSSKPTDISISPATTIKTQMVEKENWHISIPQVSPGELVIITCLYINQAAAWISSVKSAEVVGHEVEFMTQRKFGPIFNSTVIVLLLAGVAFIFSILVRLFT
ncbi:MAG: hypothetical protein Q8K33_03435 [Cypionkella sp.]|uniref:hypothetical protein n=1 Tax=Cypionkella sp. TaxID=2811411 RepID=UPI00272F8D23|nr:hypothetical protein [Cypionkella sp.]MDP2047933.1 hypothetical protein [Cypionkella sp.]